MRADQLKSIQDLFDLREKLQTDSRYLETKLNWLLAHCDHLDPEGSSMVVLVGDSTLFSICSICGDEWDT